MKIQKNNPSIQSDLLGKNTKKDPKVEEAAKMYEQLFLKEMVGAMRQAVQKSDLVEESMSEKIYTDKMYEKYLDEWGQAGGVGLSDIIYDQIMERYYQKSLNNPHQGKPIPLKEPKLFDTEVAPPKGQTLNKKI